MNIKFNLDSQAVRAIYNTHRQYVSPVFMLIISVLLLFFAIIPEFQDFLSTLSARSDASQKLTVLNNNLKILTKIDDSTLDSQFSISLKALPQTKDFESILSTMSNAANKSGVSLGDFEFNVGDLSTSSKSQDQSPSLTVTLTLNSDALGSIRFLGNLAQSLPISEVKTLDVNGRYANLGLLFYYKSTSLIKAEFDSSVIPISAKQQELLKQLESWDTSNGFSVTPLPSDLNSPASTPSSSITSPF